jgi:hypothetical protein
MNLNAAHTIPRDSCSVCGSYARGTARPDSDIDIALVSPDPDTLLNERDWLDTFGTPTVVGVEDYGLVQSIRVYYGTLEVEFGIAGLEWVEPPIDSGRAEVLRDPMRILHDPERLFDIAIAAIQSKTNDWNWP